MKNPNKLFRITTVPLSLKTLLKGQHHFMSHSGFKVIGVSSTGKELDDVHEDEGISVVALEMTRIMSPVKDLKSLWNFYRLCKKEQPTIVHSHTPKAGIVGMLGARMAGVPIRLHTVAGMPLMEASGIKRKVLDFVEKITYATATKVYPNSRGLYDFIIENKYTTKEKLAIIANGSSNGIDTTYFSSSQVSDGQRQELRSKLNILQDDFVFVFVGRLVGDKGINELVAAFKTIPSFTLDTSHPAPRIKLLLVGSLESELDPLKVETLKDIEKNDNIISVGYQKDVRPFFAISDALVFPSYREGFPNVVMQAGAMGLPCVVSDINGCNEIIVEGENGTIIPVKNSDALMRAMQKIMNDKEYYQKLKNRARPMIQERYEQQVVWHALLQEYNALLKKKGIL